jgi:PAS domain S-box-containing protein
MVGTGGAAAAARMAPAESLVVPGQDDVFFAAVRQAGLAMVVTDPRRHDNPVVFASAAFLRLTGYSSSEVLGRNCRFMQGPDTDQRSVESLRCAFATRSPATVELVNYRRSGEPFWNALFVSPVFGPDGELLYYFGSQLDVTRQRATEASRRNVQKLEAVGQLTSGIAHDFNNLLMVIGGNLEMLGTADDPQRRRRLASRIEEAVSRAQRLTQQLLAFSCQQHLHGGAVDLNALLDAMAGATGRKLGPGIHLQLRLAADAALCLVDAAQAETAVVNLLLNARDAMPHGGIVTITTGRVVLGAEALEVASGEVPAGEYVSLTVADAGSGMPPDVLGRATEPFFTTKDGGPGCGLGLAAVHGFAQQSRGHLRLSSQPGQGTSARLLFPRAP